MITKEIRNQTFESAENVKQYLYASASAGAQLFLIATKFNLQNEPHYKQFALTIGDIILGFYKIEDTVPLLQQELELDARTAALLGAEVLDFLAPLSDPNWQPPAEQDEVTNPETVQTSEINPVPQVNPANEYIESHIQVEQELPELRTMAADMIEGRSPVRATFNAAASIDEPVYVSTQPTIEKKAPEAPSYAAPLYEPPKPNVDAPLEKPRWS